MKIFLATWAEDGQGVGLTKAGNKNRLMSYFFLQKENKNYIKQYVRHGQVIHDKKK